LLHTTNEFYVLCHYYPIAHCHRSRDLSTHDGPFPIGGPLDPSLYL